MVIFELFTNGCKGGLWKRWTSCHGINRLNWAKFARSRPALSHQISTRSPRRLCLEVGGCWWGCRVPEQEAAADGRSETPTCHRHPGLLSASCANWKTPLFKTTVNTNLSQAAAEPRRSFGHSEAAWAYCRSSNRWSKYFDPTWITPRGNRQLISLETALRVRLRQLGWKRLNNSKVGPISCSTSSISSVRPVPASTASKAFSCQPCWRSQATWSSASLIKNIPKTKTRSDQLADHDSAIWPTFSLANQFSYEPNPIRVQDDGR